MNTSFRPRHKNKNIMIYASSNTDADMFYATNFRCSDPFIFIRTARGKRHLIMSDLEIDRAKSESNAHEVHSLSAYQQVASKTFGANYGVAHVLCGVFRDLAIRSIAVPRSFPVGVADDLREKGVRVKALGDPFFPERIYKKPAEIAEIKKALRVTEKGIKAAVDILRSSKIKEGYLMYDGKKLTAEALRTNINTTLLAAGYLPSGTIVAPGKKGCDPHDQGSGVIRPNEPVIIDVFPRSEQSGYFGDITRTVVRGKASDTVRRMFRAVLEGQRLGLRSIKHGVKTRSVHVAINRLFEERGFTTGEKNGRMQGFFHGTGHGLGLEIHEPPRIGMKSITLERGMVVTVEPGLYYYPHGGVRIEDTVLVTRTGIKNLTRLPKFLEI